MATNSLKGALKKKLILEMSITLTDRKIIQISGEEREQFLQSLITNDIIDNKSSLIYSAMLNPQGRFLFDFFIFKQDQVIFIDCLQSRLEEILKKLNFYKLRKKLEIKALPEFLVTQIFDQNITDLCAKSKSGSIFQDPRHQEMGLRAYFADTSQLQEFAKASSQEVSQNQNDYHFRRINLKIAESEHDLTYEKSFIIEYGFDNLNAINYKKGCYIGQENTARTHYKGVIRKNLFTVKIANLKQIDKGTEIINGGEKIGAILSSTPTNQGLVALALIKNLDINDQEIAIKDLNLQAAENKIIII